MFGPTARFHQLPACIQWVGRSGGLLLLVGALLGVAGATRAAAGPDDRFAPIDERLARERARRLGDILQVIGELPAADRALIAAGQAGTERTRRIARLTGLRGRGVGTSPESTAVAAGWLDLLLQDAPLRAHPIGPRLQAAAESALQLLLTDPPRLRSRTIELLQSLRAQSPTAPEAWAVTHTRTLASVVTPLPGSAGPSVASLLLEGNLPGPLPAEERWDLPPGATARWIADGSGVLIQGPDQLYRLRTADTAGVVSLGPLQPGAPLALAPAGDYAAGVAPGGARDSLSLLKLYRLGEHVDAIVLDRGRRFVALDWVAGGTRLAALVDNQLKLYELAIARPKEMDLGIAPEGLATARLIASPTGDRLVVADARPVRGSAGATRRPWRLRWFDPTGLRALDSLEVDGLGPFRFAPDGRSLLAAAREPGPLLALRVTEDRFRAPEPLLERGAAAGPPPLELVIAPDGGRMALLEPAAPPSTAGESLHTLGPLLGVSRFLELTAGAGVRRLGEPDAAPALSTLSSESMAWHPSGRWLAVAHPLGGDRRLLLLHDLDTGDAFPLGDGSGEAPVFSPRGDRVLWREVDRFGRGAHRLVVRRLAPTAPDGALARHWDAIAFDAHNTERPSDALDHYRNAVRLAPGVASFRLGLARAYRVLAEPMSVGGLQGWTLEGAARAAAIAFELNSRSPEIQVEFYEDQLLRAALVGQMQADGLRAGVQAELQSYDGPTLYAPTGPGAGALMDRCVAGLLWQPGDEELRVLYEGLAARSRAREPSGR